MNKVLVWSAITAPPTPIIDLEMPYVTILAKLEYLQPGGSVKGRIAGPLLDDMLSKGVITSSTKHIVEATSGNTAVALADAARQKGLQMTIVAVVKQGIKKNKLARLSQHGVITREVAVLPTDNPMTPVNAHLVAAYKICEEYPDSVRADQFFNSANPLAHENTTGKEIVRQVRNPPDAIVLGVGTGGTLMGISAAVRKAGWPSRIVLADPEGSVIAPTWRGERLIYRKSIVDGIGHDFVPPLLDFRSIDDAITVPDQLTKQTWQELFSAGFPVGFSSACSVAAATIWAKRTTASDKPRCLVIFADHGAAYIE